MDFFALHVWTGSILKNGRRPNKCLFYIIMSCTLVVSSLETYLITLPLALSEFAISHASFVCALNYLGCTREGELYGR